jgi:hypothetical protein
VSVFILRGGDGRDQGRVNDGAGGAAEDAEEVAGERGGEQAAEEAVDVWDHTLSGTETNFIRSASTRLRVTSARY